jgi:hypothetical protein
VAKPTATFLNWNRLIQANNNLAWLSFNVAAPPPGEGVQRFPVKVAGTADRPRRFALSASGTLPAGSVVALDAPAALVRALGVVLRDSPATAAAETAKGKGEAALPCVRIPLALAGRSGVGEGALPVGFAAACELRVRVPAGAGVDGAGSEFALVQECKGNEVGRSGRKNAQRGKVVYRASINRFWAAKRVNLAEVEMILPFKAEWASLAGKLLESKELRLVIEASFREPGVALDDGPIFGESAIFARC